MTTTANRRVERKPKRQPEILIPGQLTSRQIAAVLTGLMLGMFLAALDQTIISASIRTIADDLQGLSIQAWATTAYLITATISTPIYGKLSDLQGRKRWFITAITVFIIGSVLSGFARSMYELAGFRALQGLGAGGLFSLALAILGDIVPPRERAKYQGYFLAVFGTSSVLGPVIGGLLAGQEFILGVAGWRWVFLVNVPVGLVALVVVTRVLNLHHERQNHRIDWWGAMALVVGVVPLLVLAEQGREWGWASPLSFGLIGLAIAGIVSGFFIERSMGDEALIPLRLFSGKTFSVGTLLNFIVGIGMFGGLATLPLYLQIVKGASPTKAGLLMLPMTLGIMTGSIFSGQMISATGKYKIFPVVGVALMSGGAFLLSTVGVDTTLWFISMYMFVFGVGLGFNMQPVLVAVQAAADRRDMGVSTSSVTFARQMGGTFGTAIFLSILFSTAGGNIRAAFGRAMNNEQFNAALADPAVQANPANKPALDAALAAQAGEPVGTAGVLNDSSFLTALDPRLARPFLEGYSQSIGHVLVFAGAIIAIGLLVVPFLPNVTLDDTNHAPPAE